MAGMADVNAQPGGTGRAMDGQSQGPGLGFLLRLALWVVVLSAAWIAFIIVAPINSWFPEATRQAVEVDDLFKFMLAAGGAVFIMVQVLLVAFVMKYRSDHRHPDQALGAQMHGNTRLELTWTAIPALFLVVLLFFTIRVWGDEHTSRPNQLELGVHGYQYNWTFDLPQYGVYGKPTVALLVNRPVYVSEYSDNVIHSFWVPEFRVKEDDVPGVTNHEWFTPTETGKFRVICTEYCGVGHSGMVATLWVMSQKDFYQWLRQNGANPKLIPAGTASTAHAVAALVRH